MTPEIHATPYCTLIRNPDGPVLGIANPKTPGMGQVPLIEEDGQFFKDLARQGTLLPYEDWRLSAEERARDLAARLSREEVAGLMLYSSHQIVPFVSSGHFVGHYGGASYDETKHEPDELTDEQIRFIRQDHIRHILQMRVCDARTSARWSNRLQELCESERWGIPTDISTDPRHGAGRASAEFKQEGSGVSKWPEGIGFAAAGSPELVGEFARIASAEYRALGITTALGPQIDLSTEPRWMRLEDTLGHRPDRVIPMVRAYCDGMQTTEGTEDGWGRESVVTMVKHWPGGGTGEGGRDAHYPYGCFAVYPAGQFETHMRPFTEGAFHLDGPTGCAAAVMPYYTVSWLEGQPHVGNSYSSYIIHDLLRERAGYKGIVCTDWGITGDPDPEIDSFGSRCYGVPELSVAERHLRILMNGVDQFGGNDSAEPILEAWRLGDARYGLDTMDRRMRESAERLLLPLFRLGLFENPYLDPEESARIVGAPEFVRKGLEAQARSVVRLKNREGILPLRKGMRIYVPGRSLGKSKSFFRSEIDAHTDDPLEGMDTAPWFERVDTPEAAEAILVFMESPLSDPYQADEGNGYHPLMLQYRPYTATEARSPSIAGGDFRETFTDRSYRGKSNRAINECDLQNVEDAALTGKKVIAVIYMHNPTVPAEFEPLCDGILVHFGVSLSVLLDILFGDRTAGGRLPYNLPASMAAVERHAEDDPEDPEPYRTAEGTVYAMDYRANAD
ncbi:MAG: glycoside hydrolase family 3 C-terminal domain-containing protein [Clostridia bacterium]|nr:glycoside hydrolase family 3 C-terminal domain-containing protein [Clostridia bacterium]